MGLIFLFVDGIGLASPSEANPFSLFQDKLPGLTELTGSASMTADAPEVNRPYHIFRPADANLDTEGLPQSGTGQTSLFTGINAAKLIGKHFGPYPHSGNKPLLRESGIFQQIHSAGKSAWFMNAYPPVFFERAKKTRRWSCSTLMVKSSGQKLCSTEDVRIGKAVTAELFGDYWKEKLGIELPERRGEDVAEILINAAGEHDFVMLEYYLTDKAGHAMDSEFAFDTLQRLDSVLLPLMNNLNGHTFVLCSDHGNLEDLSTKTHTRNPVPLVAAGPKASFFERVMQITDVAPAMMAAIRA